MISILDDYFLPEANGLTDGVHIPPDPGSLPCGEYDPAGSGAGVEADGLPQCAMCGFPKSEHL